MNEHEVGAGMGYLVVRSRIDDDQSHLRQRGESCEELGEAGRWCVVDGLVAVLAEEVFLVSARQY